MIKTMVRLGNGNYTPIDKVSAREYGELDVFSQQQVSEHIKEKIASARRQRLALVVMLTGVQVVR